MATIRLLITKRTTSDTTEASIIVFVIDSEPGVENAIFENVKKVVKIYSESIFQGFVMLILTNLTSKVAGNIMNEPKLQKSI